MKKIFSLILCVSFILCLASCTGGPMYSEDGTQTAQNGDTSAADTIEKMGMILRPVSKEAFASDITVPYGEKTLTVKAPIYTGISSFDLDGYKQYCFCMNGAYVFKNRGEGGALFKVSKTGEILDTSYTETNAFPRERPTVYTTESEYTYRGAEREVKQTFYVGLKDKSGTPVSEAIYIGFTVYGEYAIGTTDDGVSVIFDLDGNTLGKIQGSASFRGENVLVSTDTVEGKDAQRLYNINGEPISAYFDSIGFFYNGLALITEENAVGLIDDRGNTVLAPYIPFDETSYPPTAGGIEVLYMEEDSFYLSIGGEIAIVNIER